MKKHMINNKCCPPLSFSSGRRIDISVQRVGQSVNFGGELDKVLMLVESLGADKGRELLPKLERGAAILTRTQF